MKKYAFLAERFYKYFKYLRVVSLVSLIIFLVTTAINTGNNTLYIISYFFMVLTLVTAMEAVVLYVLSFVLKK